MWSAALDAILTTLRYLAPATLLTLFWGQQSFLFKILKHIDSVFRAIVFSSEEQKEAVLQWIADAGPVSVDHLDTVWRHGWIICGVLDAALPGACAGHPPTKLSLKHAQAIADHYLGVEPVFSRQELESNDSLSRHQEWKLATYLDRIRQALAKLTPPVSKPTSQRTSPETTQFTLDYVAKGSGLTAAQVKSKMYFKIYPTAQQSLDPGEITVLIRGPKDTYGLSVFPPILGKAQMIRQKLLGLQTHKNYTENALPITQGAAYFRAYGRNDMNKTYYIPKAKYDIEIEVEMRLDHAKISYVVDLEGRHEISITSRGQSIVGSPFAVIASHNIISILEKESYRLEDGEEIDILDVQTDKKVVLRIVDFVTEKMLLKENGTLEKISDEEAKMLMLTDSENDTTNTNNQLSNRNNFSYPKTDENTMTFSKIAHKVLKINRVCKVLNDLISKKRSLISVNDDYKNPKTQQDIPDIVNSTFSEINTNPFISIEKRNKIIIPENISVSLRTEKSKLHYEGNLNEESNPDNIITSNMTTKQSTSFNNSPDNIKKCETQSMTREDRMSIGQTKLLTSWNNPFASEHPNHNLLQENILATIMSSENTSNTSRNEEMQKSSIKIIIDPTCTPCISPTINNLFMKDTIHEIERPKSPIFKMMTSHVSDTETFKSADKKSELIPEEMLGNEFINPFFIHHHTQNPHENLPLTDFIIGAPVSLPPIIRTSSPEPDMKSLILTPHNQKRPIFENITFDFNDNDTSDISETFKTSEPLQYIKNEITTGIDKTSNPSTFHSMESNLIVTGESPKRSDNQYQAYEIDDNSPNSTLNKDTWDSAYVSIDDNNSTHDNNNNDNAMVQETGIKRKFAAHNTVVGIKKEELSLMGQAEREIWQTCTKIREQNSQESAKLNKGNVKLAMFTPITEENDKTILAKVKDMSRSEKSSDTDSVSVAFAELNEIFTEYFPVSENNSTTMPFEMNKPHNMEVDYNDTLKETSVNSASEMLSDVKRHKYETEGTISEVQPNVAESFSVSQTLHDKKCKQSYSPITRKIKETKFGDCDKSNIVLERKKYWDDKIRQLEDKCQDTTPLLKKKRAISSKQLKHDSLSKRKGKQMIKNFLNAGGYNQTKHMQPMDTAQCEAVYQSSLQEIANEQAKADEKIVKKWKKYWDEKLVKEQDNNEIISTRTKSSKPSNITEEITRSVEVNIENKRHLNLEDLEFKSVETLVPVKQELPEELFKAFETSPKRFFGTSRKQILNKIDIFSARSSSSEESSPEIIDMNLDTGLVSSRISLFHTLSNTEELPWANRKSKSMHNIYHQKDTNIETPFKEKKLDDTNKIPEKRSTFYNNEPNVTIEKPEAIILSQLPKIPSPDKTKPTRNIFSKKSSNTESKNETALGDSKNNVIKSTTEEIYESNLKNETGYNSDILRRKSFSKSEMDIFNKVPIQRDNDYLDKYKSYDELPKINVKRFISLYENVTKTAVEANSVKGICRSSSTDSEKLLQVFSNTSDTDRKYKVMDHRAEITKSLNNEKDVSTSQKKLNLHKRSEKLCNKSENITDFEKTEIHNKKIKDKETTYISLSDIELEIIESSPDDTTGSSAERETVATHVEYKNRFKLAKEYFQSLEELRDVKTPRKWNECELLLNKSNESLENIEHKRKKKLKSHSVPSSEISKIWNQMQNGEKNMEKDTSTTKLVKISEKFNVDDLYTDVMEGRLSRQGSLRGIPNMKAVLETFRSMENIANNKIISYEINESQLNDLTKENTVKSAQTYLSEYPYLPTTDPSKYHSRVDVKASGLISFKELLQKRPRRNSVPDLRLSPTFTEDL